MLGHVAAAAGVLALLTIIPGPDMAVVTRRALAGGRADALRAGLGVACGLLVWGSLAVLGLTALLTASPAAYVVVKVLGIGYLVFLGIQALRGSKEPHPQTRAAARSGRSPFLIGLISNLLNPKIAVFYAVLLPSLAPPSLGAWGLVTLVLIHAVLTLTWLSGYAYTLTQARALFERPPVRRALERVTGAVLVAFAVRLATDHP